LGIDVVLYRPECSDEESEDEDDFTDDETSEDDGNITPEE